MIWLRGEVSRGQAHSPSTHTQRSNGSQRLIGFVPPAFIPLLSSISPSSKKMYKVNAPRYILSGWMCEIPRLCAVTDLDNSSPSAQLQSEAAAGWDLVHGDRPEQAGRELLSFTCPKGWHSALASKGSHKKIFFCDLSVSECLSHQSFFATVLRDLKIVLKRDITTCFKTWDWLNNIYIFLNKHMFARADRVKIKEYAFFCRTKNRQAWEN